MKASNIPFVLLVVLAVGVSFYPILYLLTDAKVGLLSQKEDVLLDSFWWRTAFFLHIIPGGLALLIGWPQFIKKLRNKRMRFHRALGKIYVLAIMVSGLAGLNLAVYATGGIIAKLGFGGLALGWLFTTSMAYIRIRKKRIDEHQIWMIRSYALCFAAVTLRLWLPLFTSGFQMDFLPAYRIIAWLCWVPNLMVAEWIIVNMNRKKKLAIG